MSFHKDHPCGGLVRYSGSLSDSRLAEIKREFEVNGREGQWIDVACLDDRSPGYVPARGKFSHPYTSAGWLPAAGPSVSVAREAMLGAILLMAFLASVLVWIIGRFI